MTSNSLLSINLLGPTLFNNYPYVESSKSNCRTCNQRVCNQNLSGDDPASQYQRQKIIQNTVRVASSLYTMNLAGLASYQKPLNTSQLVNQPGTPYVAPPRVYWNQMSDRARPANQTTKTASGSAYHTSSTRHTITRDRPGAMSPGGVGVDIKHNSYDRYLNKLKGRAPLRRGIIPPNYGAPIPFNRAYPVYGGKIVKTSIVNGCDCVNENGEQDKIIYGSSSRALQDEILAVKYIFHVGDFVLAKKNDYENTLYKGEIVSIENGVYTVNFDDITRQLGYDNLLIYFNCDNCETTLSIQEKFLSDDLGQINDVILNDENNIYCNVLTLYKSLSSE